MATRSDVRRALQRAAEDLLGRPLTATEADELVTRFDKASGDAYQRALGSLAGQTKLAESQIQAKAAASDNTDRLIDDVVQTIQDLNP